VDFPRGKVDKEMVGLTYLADDSVQGAQGLEQWIVESSV
jgi:hypothetical protein